MYSYTTVLFIFDHNTYFRLSLFSDIKLNPKFCHITPLLRCLHWLKITELIEYKLSLSFHSLTMSSQPPKLHISIISSLFNLLAANTRSSSLITLARPPTSCWLRITDRFFRYASPCLWNQLPSSLRQPHLSPSVSVLPAHVPTTSPHSVNSPLSPTITPSFFHSRLKTYLFRKSFPPDSLPASGLTPRTSRPDRFF